jgi:hypothetical protein
MNSTKSMATGAVACLVALLLSATAVAQSGFGDGSGGLGDGSKKRVPASPGPLGACCLGDGSCLDLPEDSCEVLGGMYQGTGTECASVTCTPFGACCFPDITCQSLSKTDCGAAGGRYQGNASSCDLGVCPVAGACCLPDGSCMELKSHDECVALSGIYRGFLTDCTTSVCTGACSFDTGACTDGQSKDGCEAAGGDFQGGGSTCATTNAPSIVQCQTFSFSQNNFVTLTFDQFDEEGGTRELQKVTVIQDGRIVAVVVLTNLALVDKEDTDVFVVENLNIDFPEGAGIFTFQSIMIDNLVISCGFALPPGESCDFGSPLVYPGTEMDMSTDPGDLAVFTGVGTIDAFVPGTGSFEFLGSKFLLQNNPHLAEGKVTVIYEYIVPVACCFPDGSCTDEDSEADCLAAGGDPQGVGTTCATVTCDQPACCFPDGSCQQLPPADCTAMGGDPQGPDTNCATIECPRACCLDNGTCVEVTPTACTALNGTSLVGTCATVECLGACCLDDGSCQNLDGPDCTAAGGDYQGFGSSCATVECPQACCFADGTCAFLTETLCIAGGGTPQGDGTNCITTECPQACCFADGTCTFVTPTACLAAGGVPQGNGTNCVTVSCDGACCLDDGSCIEVDGPACTAAGGDYRGFGTTCAGVECPRACCLDDGTCITVTPSDCLAQNGVVQPIGDLCATITCRIAEACCFPVSGLCAELTPAECLAAGGTPQGAGMLCADVDCPETPDRGGCTEKGSLLVFSKVEIRWMGGTVNNLLQDTFLSITNDFPDDVNVMMYFVNGDPPLEADPATGERAHPGWNWLDNGIHLTANEPTYWSALTGNPKGVSPFTALDPGTPPGRPANDGTGDRVLRGFVLAWAVSGVGDEIRWNHLSGAGTVVNYAFNYAAEYNACAFEVIESLYAHGQPTGTPGILTLDGSEYSPVFGQLLFNFQGAFATGFSGAGITVSSDTSLVLHPVSADLRQSGDGPLTTKAAALVWNENEHKFSGTERCITCWDMTLISQYDTPNHFLRAFLQTDHGKARIEGEASDVCDVLDDPATPEDESVTSVPAAMLGVYCRLLTANAAQRPTAGSGSNLFGMGLETAVIRYQPVTPPPEAQLPPNPTSADVDAFIDAILRDLGAGGVGDID